MAAQIASSGMVTTTEYRAIQRHYDSLVENLGKTVDPAHFARKLREESLISESVVDKASLVGVLTGSERITPAIDAVLAQIKLKADNFHTFMSILKAENSDLADTISEYYTSSLELHALGVLESVSEWKELGHQLNVVPEKLLLLSQSGRDSDYCREQVVTEWLKEDKAASWEKLCRALERMGSETEVLKVRECYLSADVPAAKGGVDNDCSDRAGFDVAEEVSEFEGRFADLTFRLQTEMEKEETPVKKFRQSITLLPQAIRKEHLQFIKDSMKDIMNAASIEQLFVYLNLYWSFFDYSLLEHFVTRHGSKELKDEITKYANDLEVFRKKTTFKQLLEVCPNGFRSEEPPPHFSDLTCKLDQNASEYSLEELEQFRRQFCSQYSLPTFALMLASVGHGSVTIVWHIPSSEVHRLLNTTVQWNSISTDLLQFKVDGLLLEFAWKFSAQALTEYTALTHLYLSFHGIGANEMAVLLSSLNDKSHIRHVELSFNHFGSEGAIILAQALTENTALTHLNLYACGIDTDGIASLSSSLRKKSRLQFVDLSVNKFGSKGAEYLAQALTDNTALTHLNLYACGIDTDGIASLSSSLRNKSHLQFVGLGENKFGSKGAEFLAQALTENTALTHLDLLWCGIHTDGIASLSSSLRNKLHLQCVNLSGNKFGSKGAEYLAQALTENTTLTHLDLSSCEIGTDGIASLSSSLRNKSHLQFVDLSGNKFGSKGAKYLAQALAVNTTLIHLDLSLCAIGAHGMMSLSSLQNKLGPNGLHLSGNRDLSQRKKKDQGLEDNLHSSSSSESDYSLPPESGYTEWWKTSESSYTEWWKTSQSGTQSRSWAGTGVESGVHSRHSSAGSACDEDWW